MQGYSAPRRKRMVAANSTPMAKSVRHSGPGASKINTPTCPASTPAIGATQRAFPRAPERNICATPISPPNRPALPSTATNRRGQEIDSHSYWARKRSKSLQASAAASTVTKSAKDASGKLLRVRGKLGGISGCFISFNQGRRASTCGPPTSAQIRRRDHPSCFISLRASRAHPQDYRQPDWPIAPAGRRWHRRR